MSSEQTGNRLNIAYLYRLALRMHALLPYYFARSGRAFPAWHYYLEMTRRCNLRCSMCQYINWLSTTPPSEQAEDELTTDEWRGVIDQIPRFSLVTFTGGEPFIRKDFPDLLARASARCRTHIITNATLLNEERAAHCIDAAPKRVGGKGLNFVGVSIDGPPEIHDTIRNMDGAFGKSAAGIRYLHALRAEAGKKCPMVIVTTVIQEKNLEHLAQMPEVVADLGADALNFTLEVRNYELENLGEVDPASYSPNQIVMPKLDPRALIDALRKTRQAANRAHIELRLPDMPEEEIVKYYDGKMKVVDFRCGSVWSTVFIGRKGVVYPCWMRAVGNVREQKLKDIWNGPEFRAFRAQTRKGLYLPCAGCCFLVHKKEGTKRT
jgi:MoaA/NifB/PqqE/SkfB family radical SAM enzyme